MKKIFNNPWVQFGLVVLVLTLFISALYGAYSSGRKDELEGRLKRVNDTLANTRSSDESHVQLLAMRTYLMEKLRGL